MADMKIPFITLLSYNVFSGPFSDKKTNVERYNKQILQITKIDPDIICLQEFNTNEMCTIYKQLYLHQYDSYFEENISPAGNTLHPFFNGCQSLQLAIFYKKRKI
jgi:endonuclease/exonuclease/phosphatase family metal-dependent hydrolase